jgi:hypothetical protein
LPPEAAGKIFGLILTLFKCFFSFYEQEERLGSPPHWVPAAWL